MYPICIPVKLGFPREIVDLNGFECSDTPCTELNGVMIQEGV